MYGLGLRVAEFSEQTAPLKPKKLSKLQYPFESVGERRTA
jgi:hypothetical protein